MAAPQKQRKPCANQSALIEFPAADRLDLLARVVAGFEPAAADGSSSASGDVADRVLGDKVFGPGNVGFAMVCAARPQPEKTDRGAIRGRNIGRSDVRREALNVAHTYMPHRVKAGLVKIEVVPLGFVDVAFVHCGATSLPYDAAVDPKPQRRTVQLTVTLPREHKADDDVDCKD